MIFCYKVKVGGEIIVGYGSIANIWVSIKEGSLCSVPYPRFVIHLMQKLGIR